MTAVVIFCLKPEFPQMAQLTPQSPAGVGPQSLVQEPLPWTEDDAVGQQSDDDDDDHHADDFILKNPAAIARFRPWRGQA
jgi:hypothetical protein